MVNFKDWHMTRLGNLILVGLMLVVLIILIHVFVSPLLVTLVPTVFTTPLTLTDTLLFFILIRLIVK